MGTDHHVIYISVLRLGKLYGSLSDPVCIDNNFTEKLIFYFLCGKPTATHWNVFECLPLWSVQNRDSDRANLWCFFGIPVVIILIKITTHCKCIL